MENEVDYYNLKLPGELVKKIDAYVEGNPWGYRSRAEVVTEAVRTFLRHAETEQGGWNRPKGDRRKPSPR
ncbi:MAG: ribbon-helix-helix domain-containing protein [Thermoplasmatota archaeon]